MLDFESVEGNGLTAYETMDSLVEAVQLKMIKGRFSKLFVDEEKMNELLESLLPSHEQKSKAIEVLTKLSKRERQCFLMHTVDNMSFKKIADELNLGKSTVQIFIERARKKINNMEV